MKMVLPQISLTGQEPCAMMSVTYTATLSVRAQTVLYLSRLLHAERSTGHPQRHPYLELLQAGGAGDPLVARRHPGAAVGGRQRDRQNHRLRAPS